MENQLPESICNDSTIAVDTETLEEKAEILEAEAVVTWREASQKRIRELETEVARLKAERKLF